MRFDRLGIIELVEEARACSASSVCLSISNKPLYRIGSELIASRFTAMTNEDAVRVEKMLARESGVLDKQTNLVTQNEFVCRLDKAGSVRVNLVRGHDGPAIELSIIPALAPSLSSVGLPAGGGLARRGGSINLIGGHKAKQVGVALIRDYCSSKASSVVTIEHGIEYELREHGCWIVQQSLGAVTKTVSDGISSLSGGNVDLLYVEGLSDAQEALSLIELAEQGVDIVVSMRCGSIESLESAFLTVLGDKVKNGDLRLSALIGNRYTYGRHAIEANLIQASNNASILSINSAV